MRILMSALCGLLRVVSWVVSWLPASLGYAVSDAIAWFVHAIDGTRRRRALRNVAASFPEKSADEHEQIVRAAYRNLMRVGYDFLVSGHKLRPDTVDDVVTFEGAEHLRDVQGVGGTVTVTAHVGNWEVLGLAAGLKGIPLCAVARGVHEVGLNTLLLSYRERHGQEILSVKGAVDRGREVLRAGKHLAFTADQHARRSRIWAPFFGCPNAYVKTPASLARRYGAPLAFGFCRRTGPGFRFTVTVFPVLRPDPERSAREDVARMTLAYAQCLETFVRAHPGDYLWMHKLWRTPVDGEELVREDGTYVRHATFGSDAAPAGGDSRPNEPGAPGTAR